MDLSQIPVGVEPPWDIHAVIEIPQGGIPVKYELEKKSGALFVDRFLHTSMYYPGNYGFVPQTLAEDGDPCDIVVVGQVPVVPGAVIRCRPIGALIMRDEAGGDEKIVAVPVDKLHPFYSGVRSYKDLPPILIDQIAHFFQHYKDLEKGKWVTIVKWDGPEGAARLIREGIARVQGVKVPSRPFKGRSGAEAAALAKAKLRAKATTPTATKARRPRKKKAATAAE